MKVHSLQDINSEGVAIAPDVSLLAFLCMTVVNSSLGSELPPAAENRQQRVSKSSGVELTDFLCPENQEGDAL